jgi:hypothetical protein
MTTHTTTIRGHLIEVSFYDDSGEVRTCCDITDPSGQYSNSLGLLEDLGQFDDGGPRVSDALLAAARRFALPFGY